MISLDLFTALVVRCFCASENSRFPYYELRHSASLLFDLNISNYLILGKAVAAAVLVVIVEVEEEEGQEVVVAVVDTEAEVILVEEEEEWFFQAEEVVVATV